MSHVFLIGFMGAGKSTVGRLVAAGLDMPFVDLDDEIESADGRTIPEIFAEVGEESFRAIESETLSALAGAPSSVVACGGGIVTREKNRTLMKALGRVVYLRVTAEETLARVGDDSGRPLLTGDEGATAAAELLKAREPLYSAVADLTVDTVDRSPDDVAGEILAELRSHDAS